MINKCLYCTFVKAGYYNYDKNDPYSAKLEGKKWLDDLAVLCKLNSGEYGIWREDEDGFAWRPIIVTHCPRCGRKLSNGEDENEENNQLQAA